MGLLGEVFAFLHDVKCGLNLFGKIISGIRSKGFIVGLIVEVFHGFVDVLFTVHNYDGGSFVGWFYDDVGPISK